MGSATEIFSTEMAEAMIAQRPGAFESFAESHANVMKNFARRTCGKHAEEVVQETFLKAYQSVKDLRDPAAMKSWFYRIAINECLKLRAREFRDKAIQVPLSDVNSNPGAQGGRTREFPDWSEVPLARLLQGELREKLEEAILNLPDDYHIVLVLRDMEGFSTRQTAEILDIAEPLVKVRLHRARLAVRNNLMQYLSANPE